jgi:hypothetical protein
MSTCADGDMPTPATVRQGHAHDARPLRAFDRRTLWVAAALFAVLMALSPLYGFHRDELYFLDCGRRLQASYVDQPVLTPLLARISLSLFGVSLPGLRPWPALAGVATVIVAAVTAREVGGGRRAQLLAAVGTATMPTLLAVDHLMGRCGPREARGPLEPDGRALRRRYPGVPRRR